ncbi:conserved hypothetical protein [Trichinella spiralis]|uniref:hypothetical protein n=1 Tax=Trichinella spiralis TaxID=6334 RepID=UPI0001EFDAB0|nr:conserved hypothetical protein [Trichinella spiralis]
MVNRRLSLKLPKEKEDQLLIQKYMWHIYIYKLRLTDALKELPFPDNQDLITVENVMDFYKIAKQIKKDNLKSSAEFISKFNKAMRSLALPSVQYLYE